MSHMHTLYFYMCLTTIFLIGTPAIHQGTLTTLNNHVLQVTDISIAGKKKCIPVYRAPRNADAIITELAYNPKDCVTYLNLANIKEIEIPYPYATWNFRAHNCRGKNKFLLIHVIPHNPKEKSMYYLIEPKRRIYAHVQKNGSSFLNNFPFSGFKKCTFLPALK